jgi:hypothetical protein
MRSYSDPAMGAPEAEILPHVPAIPSALIRAELLGRPVQVGIGVTGQVKVVNVASLLGREECLGSADLARTG